MRHEPHRWGAFVLLKYFRRTVSWRVITTEMDVFNPEVNNPCCWERKENLNALDSLYLALPRTVLLSEIMSVIARGSCGICNRRNVFFTGNETLALSRKISEVKEFKDEPLCSYSFLPPEVTAKSPTEKPKSVIMQFHQLPAVQIIEFLMISCWNKKFLLYSLLGGQRSTPSRSSLCLSHYTSVPNHRGFRVGH